VSPALADSAVQQVFAETDETEQVEAYLARKFRNANLSELLQDPKKLQSVYRRLRYAGFGASVSIAVLKGYAAQADALEDGSDDGDECED
jgi:SOS response regulatory protein OraA/RecX